MDGWDQWRVICLSIMSIEDVEDVYMFVVMVFGMITLGLGLFVAYHKLNRRLKKLEDQQCEGRDDSK